MTIQPKIYLNITLDQSVEPKSIHVNKINKNGELVDKTYNYGRMIGNGNFGAVYEIIPLGQGKPKAFKMAYDSIIHLATAKMKYSKELLDNQFVNPKTGEPLKNIPGLTNYKYVSENGFSLSKFCNFDMLKALKDDNSFEFYTRYIVQTAFGLNHLHTESEFKPGLVHHDIKPANIVCEENKGSPNFYLIDFDGAQETNNLSDKETEHTEAYIGGDYWIWKENKMDKELRKAIDVHCLGVSWAESLANSQLCLERLLGNKTVFTSENLIDRIFFAQRFMIKEEQENTLTGICNLIARMTDQDWKKRPDMKECLSELASLGLEIPEYTN